MKAISRRLPLVLCALLCAASVGARAGIVFSEATIEKCAGPEDTQLVYRFPFTVSGSRTVSIKEIKALCDCLTIATDRTQYRPGESGVVTATLQLGSFEGTIAKSFNLITDDPNQGRLLLRCVAKIPPVYALSTLSIRWRVGTEPEPVAVTMRILGKEPIRVVKVASTRTNVSASFKEVLLGREYQILLTPTSTEKIETGLVNIETDCPIKKYSRRLLYFHILPRK